MADLLRSRSFAALLGAASAMALAGVAVANPAVARHPSSSIGKRIVLATKQDFGNYDVAADRAGTAYVAWLSASHSQSLRVVHLCKLPPGANSCVGGVQTTSAIDGSTAAGLRVLSTPSGGKVTLVWFHDTAASQTGPEGGEIAMATAVHGRNLSAASDVADAPSSGTLMDVEYGPNFSIWTVARPPLPVQKLQVHPGLDAPHVTAGTPFTVGGAQITFTKGKPVMAIDKDAAISEAARYATGTAAGHFSSFHRVAGTWTNALSVLKSTPHGVRLIATSGPHFYRPAIAKWNGHGFGKPALTADHNPCAPSTHDASTDASGRLLDVSIECDQIAVANYVDDNKSTMYRFSVGGTATSIPQIASGARGVATVVWSRQTPAADGDTLQVLRVALPDTTRAVHNHGKGGRITLIGPTTCLPPSLVHLKLGAKAAKHWAIRTRTIRLGHKAVKHYRINGADLTPGKSYTLHGTAVFAKGGSRNTVKAALTFRTCPTT